jgi:hypothetical protein
MALAVAGNQRLFESLKISSDVFGGFTFGGSEHLDILAGSG